MRKNSLRRASADVEMALFEPQKKLFTYLHLLLIHMYFSLFFSRKCPCYVGPRQTQTPQIFDSQHQGFDRERIGRKSGSAWEFNTPLFLRFAFDFSAGARRVIVVCQDRFQITSIDTDDMQTDFDAVLLSLPSGGFHED